MNVTSYTIFDSNKQGELATAFDLAAFRLSMIAPVQKSVNHPRSVASMRERVGNNNNKFVFAAIPKCEVNSLLVLLVFVFFAVTNFFSTEMWSLRFPF